MPINYQLGKIYKIESSSGLIYIGSTCEPTLARRLSNHKRGFNIWKGGNKNKYITSYRLFEEDEEKINIYLIENYPCNTKDELHKREGEIIKSINCVNKYIPGRSEKQWKDDNKIRISDIGKIYREKNALKLTQKNICECGGTYQTTHKSAHTKTKKHINYSKKI
jgi:hypothetical protein